MEFNTQRQFLKNAISIHFYSGVVSHYFLLYVSFRYVYIRQLLQVITFAVGHHSFTSEAVLLIIKLHRKGSLAQSFDTVNQLRALSRTKKKKLAYPGPNWSSVNAVGPSPVASIQRLTSVLSISPCQRAPDSHYSQRRSEMTGLNHPLTCSTHW